MPVIPKTPEELEGMRVAGRLAAEVLAVLKDHIKPGVTTEEIDQIAYHHIVDVQGAVPANVGYRGFPKTLCTSVNHVICHGIPSPGKVLKEGDIINCDVTVIKDGWHGDTSRMYFVGEPSVLAKRLVDTTYEAMMLGIGQVRPGVSTSNLTLLPGGRSQAELMRDAGAGLLVTSMFGPSLNAHTGDWSVGCSGFWFEGGEIAYPVNEITVAGNLIDIFGRIVPGSGLEIRGAANAPSLLVDAVAIAGR